MFKDKKILVIVPHQDDEINVAGGFIARFSSDNEIYVLYTTNGDYIYDAETRYSECLKSCEILGVDKKRVLFMGYSDQYSDGYDHLYMTNSIWKSRKGVSETYLPFDKEEIAKKYKGSHNKFNKQNFVADMKLCIEKLMPDVLVCIDFDSHCDHRATSLAFEHVLGSILNEKEDYSPLVYKGFAYPTSYLSIDDFDSLNIKSTRFKPEPFSFTDAENPYYVTNDCVRFSLGKDCIEKRLWKNRIFKALKCHRSQVIIQKAKSIINGDQLYFVRRTDNLLRNSEIKASSGDVEKLRDFVLFDCENILNGNSKKPKLVDCAWVPEDKEPQLDIELKKKMKIAKIKIYNSINSQREAEFDLFVDGRMYGHYSFEKNLVNELCFSDGLECKKIKIIFKNNGLNLSISELEVLEWEAKKIVSIDATIRGDIVYDYYYDGGFKLKMYGQNNYERVAISDDLLDYCINGVSAKHINDDHCKLKKKAEILVRLKSDNSIQNTFVLIQKNKLVIFLDKLLNIFNDVYLRELVFAQKVYRKVFIKRFGR